MKALMAFPLLNTATAWQLLMTVLMAFDLPNEDAWALLNEVSMALYLVHTAAAR
jgi:hypothetical protein